MTVRGRRHPRRETREVLRPVFGDRVPHAMLLAVVGPPGAGKSTWTLKVAEYESYQRPVLALTEESPDGLGVADRIQRVEATRVRLTDACSMGELALLAQEEEPDLLCVDSVSAAAITPEECLALRRTRPAMTLLVTLQVTKSGEHLGSMSWLHDCDAVVELPEPGRFRLRKCWFASQSEGELS